MSMIGHNRGPSMTKGDSWARHCWSVARAELLPTLPLEIIRLRVARAKAIGLEYRTYATIRASSGCDIIAFLYSSEALQVRPVTLTLPPGRVEKLSAQDADKILLSARDIEPEVARQRFAEQGVVLAHVAPAPQALGTFRQARAALRHAMDKLKLPGDGVVLVGEGSLQRDWAEAGRLAGFLPAERFFATA